MTITILDPTHEEDSKVFQMASGLKNLKGARIGFALSPMEKKGPTPFSTSWKAFSKMNMTSEKWSEWLRKTTRLLQIQKS